jgi:putative transposase
MKYPKKPRLKNFEYSGPNIYFVTLRTAKNKEVFTTELSVSETHAILKTCTNKHAFGIIAYCYMPDHLHVLIEGKQESNLKKFMKEFKQRTSYLHKMKEGTYLWQQSYYDHILRNTESFIRVGRYIVNNPVRAKLVKDFQDYPYIGSETLDPKDFLTAEPDELGKPT